MDRWERVMKCILLTVNVVILIFGTITTITSVCLISKPSYIAETKGFFNAIFIALLIVGIIWMSIAIFGIVAVLRKVKCMLLTYAIIIFILFVMNVIGQVEQYNSQKEMIKLLEKRLKSSMQLYNDNIFVRNFWDMTQSTYECCGLNSWKDWKVNGLTVPDSCCKSDQFFGLISSSILYKKIKYQEQSTLYDAGLNNQDPECMGLRNI
ncbi:tetraspanin-9 isoform X2 [Solenopsis invicta]|uniref:tetraspanin-9 isoform X2 n=1 Tax=Solenopsis invicta TaxID=13686 RepID=UPI00193EB17F|nr:tetraspanin-9 isoform X2 [Solenopsis invicta]